MTIQSEQILEYIDGMLDPQSEQALFDALARQPELRLALRQFISIGEAVRADREAYAPPASVERSLMAGIGLSAAELGLAVSSVGLFERLGILGARYLGMIIAFILGLLLSGISMYLIIGSGSNHRVAGDAGERGGTASPAQSQAVPGATATSGATGAAGTTRTDVQTNAQAGQAAGVAAQQPSTALQPGAGTSSVSQAPAQSSLLAQSSQGVRTVESPNGSGAASPNNNSMIRSAQNARTVRQTSGYEAPSSAHNSSGTSNAHQSVRASAPRRPDGSGAASATRTAADAQSSAANAPNSTRPLDNVTTTSSTSSASATTEPAMARVESTNLRAAAITATSAYDDASAHRSPSSLPLEEVSSAASVATNVEADHGLITELRYQGGGSLNSSNARTIGTGGRDAFALGAYWQFNRSLACGLEGGNETFDQTLRYRDGDTLQIDQRPSYFWGGVALRYYLGALSFANLQPYLQTGLGGTAAGPLLRFRLAAQYDISSDFSTTLGGEFSSLFYTFDKQHLTSGRWGVTLGLQYAIR